MKLLYVVRSLHPVGGIERTLSDKANWMAAQGHEVMFVTYIQGKDSICFPLDDRIQLYDLDCSTFPMYQYSFLSRFFFYSKLKAKFKNRLRYILDFFMPDAVVVAIPSAALEPTSTAFIAAIFSKPSICIVAQPQAA